MKDVRFEDFPKLGFGIMRVPMLPGDEKKIDEETFCKMVDSYMAAGMNYFDTAYVYYNGESEKLLGKYLIPRYDRDSFYIVSKMPFWAAKTEEDLEGFFIESLTRCGVEYFDLYMMHCLNVENVKKIDAVNGFEYMKRLKREGRAKLIGFSFHDTPERLDEYLNKYPEVDFVQLQINYLDWDGPMQSSKFYEIARKHNKPIIIMEPVRGGALANVPPSAEKLFKEHAPKQSVASWALRFAASLPGVVVTLSGMSNMEQLTDNIETLKRFKPVTDEEKEVIFKARDIIVESNLIACTACGYCADCPSKIDIARMFTLYNDFQKTLETESTVAAKYKSNSVLADACVECGACEKVCPQQLEIKKHLKMVHNQFKG